jgi:diacylglycerol kinase family enzyme
MARSLIARRRYPHQGVRIALIANAASGGGFDPEPLAATMRRHGADVSVYAPKDLDALTSSEPERIAVAGGDGTIAGLASAAAHRAQPLKPKLGPLAYAVGAIRAAGSEQPLRCDGVLDVTVLPAGSRLALARRAWGLRRGTIAEQRDVCHARGHVIEVDLPPGTEFNVDGELLDDDGMRRVTVERDAFELMVG